MFRFLSLTLMATTLAIPTAMAQEAALAPAEKQEVQQSIPLEQVITLHQRVVDEVPLATHMIEYGCTDRSEIIIGHLLSWGVPEAVVGRVSSYQDVRFDEETEAFRFQDAMHGEAFQRAWEEAFGSDEPKKLRLIWKDVVLDLDVDGEIQWGIGHIAPTITATDGTHYVIDPVLSPEKPIQMNEWLKLQKAETAALIWGGVDEKPRLVEAPELTNDELAAKLQIKEEAAWHPRHWAGYSFVGAQRDADGKVMGDWLEADSADAKNQLLQRAQDKLMPLRLYQEMREKTGSPELFIAELKAQQKPDDEVLTLRLEN